MFYHKKNIKKKDIKKDMFSQMFYQINVRDKTFIYNIDITLI